MKSSMKDVAVTSEITLKVGGVAVHAARLNSIKVSEGGFFNKIHLDLTITSASAHLFKNKGEDVFVSISYMSHQEKHHIIFKFQKVDITSNSGGFRVLLTGDIICKAIK